MKTINVTFWYKWNLLTRRKGEAKWSSMFLLNFSQATKGGMNLLFFFFTFRLYLFGVKLKRKLVPFRFSSLKIKMQFFDHNGVISKCNLQLKHSLIFSFQNQHDKLILVRFMVLFWFFLFFSAQCPPLYCSVNFLALLNVG